MTESLMEAKSLLCSCLLRCCDECSEARWSAQRLKVERPEIKGMQSPSHALYSCVSPLLSLHGSCICVSQERLLCERVYGVSADLPIHRRC